MRIIRGVTVFVFVISVVLFLYGKKTTMKQDVIPPVIASEQDVIQVEASSDKELLLEGLTAFDDTDGDLTNEIIIGNISDFTEKGVSTVEYLVFDKSNNVGRYERTVEFLSYQSPRFTLTKPLVYKIYGDILISDRLFAEDVLSGDISDKIKYSSVDLNQSERGTYDLNVEVKSPYGDIVKEVLPVNMVPYELSIERIHLETYLVYVKKGETIDPETYITKVLDSYGNEISKDQVSIVSEVNFDQAGCGQIRFELYRGEDVNYVTYLTVIVTE